MSGTWLSTLNLFENDSQPRNIKPGKLAGRKTRKSSAKSAFLWEFFLREAGNVFDQKRIPLDMSFVGH
jgi:hypothetical protein